LRDDDATITFKKPARGERKPRPASLRIPTFYAVKEAAHQGQLVEDAPDVEIRAAGDGNGLAPVLPVLAFDNDRIAQRRIDEWLSENDFGDDLDRRATWQKVVTYKTPTVVPPPAFAATATDAPALPQSPSPMSPVRAIRPLAAPPDKHGPPPGRDRRRLTSFPRLSSWVTMLIILALLLGGAFGIFVSLGKQPKPGASVMSLTVTPASIAPGGTITLHGAHFSPNGQVGLLRDGTIPLLDTGGQSITRADASGSFQDTVNIDNSWTTGPHTIYAEDAHLHKTAWTSIEVSGPPSKTTLPPHLTLSAKSVDLGSGDQATNATQQITLSNAGGGQINWQATATQPWLLLSPASGSFTSGQQVRLAGDRSNLQVGTYTASVIFTSSAGRSTLPVQMKVTPLEPGHEAVLQATPAVLSFSAIDGGFSPSAQVVTISNPGVRPLNWSGFSATYDGANWLSLSPSSGTVAKGDSQSIAVFVDSSLLLPGVYYGTITFSNQGSEAVMNSPQTIYISVTIAPQCSIQVSPGALTFTAVYLQPAPAAKAIGIGMNQSCATPLAWSAAASTSSGGSWLTISAARGSTPSSPAVGIKVAGVLPGTYNGQLLFSSTAGTQTVPVTLIMARPITPIMTTSVALLNENGITGTGQPPPTPQSVVLSNTGGGTLAWKASVTTATGGPWLSVTPISGSLPSQQATNLSVGAAVLPTMVPGVYNGTITLTGTDGAGHPAAGSPQTVAVTFTVQAPCAIAASVPALTFQGVIGQPTPATQAVTISASGACANALSWTATTATTPAGGTWLATTPTSGTVTLAAPSSTAVGVVLTGLLAGTYSGSVTLSAIDSVTNLPVGAPQVVAITLNVQPPCTLQAPSVTTEAFSSEAGLNPTTQTFTIGVIGACTGSVTITPTASTTNGGAWLSISPTSATISSGAAATFTVSATAAGLGAGTYNGSLSLAAVDGGIAITGSPQPVAVSLTVLAPPVLAASPTTLTFTQATGSSTQSITVSNTGGEPLDWTAALASGAPAYVTITSATSGTLAAGAQTTVTITVDTTNVPGGTNVTTGVTISATDPLTNAAVKGSPAAVSIQIMTPPPAMQLSPTTLAFTGTGTQTVTLTNSGGNGLNWSAGTPSQPWLTVAPASGSDAAGASSPLTFSVDVTGLTTGTYQATVMITPSTGAAQTVTVNVTVN
jgi:Viral BACON domain